MGQQRKAGGLSPKWQSKPSRPNHLHLSSLFLAPLHGFKKSRFSQSPAQPSLAKIQLFRKMVEKKNVRRSNLHERVKVQANEAASIKLFATGKEAKNRGSSTHTHPTKVMKESLPMTPLTTFTHRPASLSFSRIYDIARYHSQAPHPRKLVCKLRHLAPSPNADGGPVLWDTKGLGSGAGDMSNGRAQTEHKRWEQKRFDLGFNSFADLISVDEQAVLPQGFNHFV